MNSKFVIGIVTLLVGLGIGFALPHKATKGTAEPILGGMYETNVTHLAGGFYAGGTDQFYVDSNGNITTSGTISTAKASTATVGASSSSPAALGSAAAGHFVIATGGNTGNASTTAVTANSSVFLQVEQTTPIAGTTCNTSATTTPQVKSIVAGNGFVAQSSANPVTNPICLSYRIVN